MAADELAQTRAAAAGLMYPSERDAPFELIYLSPGIAPRQQLAPNGSTVEEVSVDEFFQALQGGDDAQRFAELRRAVEIELKDLQVLRVGSVRIEIYLVGRTAGGRWAALHTTSIET